MDLESLVATSTLYYAAASSETLIGNWFFFVDVKKAHSNGSVFVGFNWKEEKPVQGYLEKLFTLS